MSIDKAAQSRATTFEEEIDPDHHEAVRLLLCHGSRGRYLIYFWALSCQVLAVNDKYSNTLSDKQVFRSLRVEVLGLRFRQTTSREEGYLWVV